MVQLPGVLSLVQCVAAGCDLPGYDLVWLFQGSCYVLNCQQGENCRLSHHPSARSTLAFLQREQPLPQTLEPSSQLEPPILDTSTTVSGLVGEGESRGRGQKKDGKDYSNETETESLTEDEFNQSQPAVGSERGGAMDDLLVQWNSRMEAGDLSAKVNPEVNMEVR